MANRDRANVCFWPIADMCNNGRLLPHLSWAPAEPAGASLFHSLLHFAFSEHVLSDVKLRPRGWTAAQPIVRFCDLITSQLRSRLYKLHPCRSALQQRPPIERPLLSAVNLSFACLFTSQRRPRLLQIGGPVLASRRLRQWRQ